jgi:hypothetical protein
VLTFIVTKFFVTHYYQATAVIRPISQADQGNLISGMTSALGSLVGLSDDEEKDAEKYISILNSYDFTMELIKQAKVAPSLLSRTWAHSLFDGRVSDYNLYQKVGALFDADFSLKTGNLTLTFLDPDPIVAKKVLGDYVNLLRDRLRQHEFESSTAAVSSIEKAVATTSDPQLEAALYDAMAKQIQRRGMAQVLDPPVVSDRAYKPKAVLDSALSGILTLILAMLFISLRDQISSAEEMPEVSPTRRTVEEEPAFRRV